MRVRFVSTVVLDAQDLAQKMAARSNLPRRFSADSIVVQDVLTYCSPASESEQSDWVHWRSSQCIFPNGASLPASSARFHLARALVFVICS